VDVAEKEKRTLLVDLAIVELILVIVVLMKTKNVLECIDNQSQYVVL
jgi:hypothetical protein